MIPDKAIARVKDGLVEAARILPEDIEKAILSAVPEGGKAESVMSAIKENLEISRKTGLPMCQDTGGFWCLASIGRDSDVRLSDIEHLILRGAEEASLAGYFRKSIVTDPVRSRKNTGNNLPPFIFYELEDGDAVELSFLLKGFGSENCSSIRMLNPTAGEDGVVNAVVQMMQKAGGKPCPPVFLGVGIGGTMDRAAFLSKKAFFRSFIWEPFAFLYKAQGYCKAYWSADCRPAASSLVSQEGTGAPMAVAFSAMEPSSVKIYHTSVTGSTSTV